MAKKESVDNNSSIISNYKKIWPYVRPYKKRAILALLITIPVGCMDAAIAWILKPYMDNVMIEKSIEMTAIIPIFIIMFSLVQSLLNYSAVYLNSWVGKKVTMDLKFDLFQKLMLYDPAFFDKTTSGKVQYKFNQDAEKACNGLLSNLRMFTTRIFASISLIFVLFWNSWQLSIIALIVLFIAVYPLSNIKKKIKSIIAKSVSTGSKIMTHYNEAFAANRVITSYNLHEFEKKRFRETQNEVFNLDMSLTKKTGILSPLMHFIISFGIAGTLWYGSHLITTNQLTPGGFVSFITALLMLYQPVRSLGSNFAAVQQAIVAMERAFNALEKTPSIKNCESPIILNGITDSIEYKNVTFSYAKDKKILNKINLKINKGEVVAFVGNSGGGKSTIVNLLPRFYDVTDGSIEIDGVNIKSYDLKSLRNNISVVFQDNVLFAGSIYHNITLGNENVTKEEIDSAIENACLKEFISSLKDGLNTEIGERGILLSGGQRQRIAIARAFLKKAPIVILDEATSALDNKSEAVVQKAIYNLMVNHTVLIVAHRLSTIRNAHKIVVVNNGEIAEIGSHEELINKEESIYSSLYLTQQE